MRYISMFRILRLRLVLNVVALMANESDTVSERTTLNGR